MTTIDKANPLPYYEQLAELLRREITDRQASGETYQLSSEKRTGRTTRPQPGDRAAHGQRA